MSTTPIQVSTDLNQILAQIWTLIVILGTAVVGTVIRFVITAIPTINS